jgi:hypothetical protein
MKWKANWDEMGILTSVICAIHCGVLPFLLPALSLFGVNIIHNIYFEWLMIGIAFMVGVYALYHGFVRHHRSYKPLLFFAFGFVFLVAKQFWIQYEYLFLIMAVMPIIYAHYQNYRLCRKVKCASPHHKH